MRRTAWPVLVPPQVRSVAAVARRKRPTYGPLWLDLARRPPLALLPDWEARPGAPWLQAHPAVTGRVRARAEASAEAARRGAPAAGQGADRVHLLPHLAAALTQVCTAPAPQLAQGQAQGTATRTPRQAPAWVAAGPAPAAVRIAPHPPSRAAARLARQRRPRRWAHAHQGWGAPQQGGPREAIAPQVGRRRRTGQRYLPSPTFPERQPRPDRARSLLAPSKPGLLDGWNHGCRNGAPLLRLLKRQGLQGRYGRVARSVRRLRQAQGLAPRQRRSDRPLPAVTAGTPRPRPPRRAPWLVRRAPDQGAADAQQR